MKILALEFSSPVRSVAVQVDGVVRGQASEQGGRTTHAMSLIERALNEGEIAREAIDCIAVGIGPGSYAGIRISIAIAQGWQLARGVKLLGISSADVLAVYAVANGAAKTFSIAMDAQQQELFVARFEQDSRGPRQIAPFRRMEEADRKRLESGEICYRPDLIELLENHMVAMAPPASALARLAGQNPNYVEAKALEPIYLRQAQFIKAPPARFGAD